MRWLVGVLALVAGLAGLGAGALMLIPTDRVSAMAVAEFERVTGRALTIELSLIHI